MPLTKEQVRTRRRGTEDPNDVQLDHPPQKKCHLPNGFPRFIKDLSYGLKKGLGDKKYVSIFPRRKLRSLLLELGSEWWEEDEEPNWKEIYNAQAKIARDKLPLAPEKLKKKSKSVQSSIRTRCSPKQVVELNATLDQAQKDALKMVNPFHTLLGLSCPILHREFVTKLAERFNPQTRTLEFNNGLRCAITEEDFARVLGFPIGDLPVPTECEEEHRDKVQEYFSDFKQAYRGINLTYLKQMVQKEGVAGDVFHRAYILFTLGCLLCPTTKDVVGSRLFPGVCATLDIIKTYKWPSFILDWLVNEVGNYKERESKQRSSQGKGIGGSLFMLMIVYFDRFPLSVHIPKDDVLPIEAWTKDLIEQRISLEAEDKPKKESILTQFPPHNMKNPGFIEAYNQRVYNFVRETEMLRELDAEMSRRELSIKRSPMRGTTLSPNEAGPSNENLTRNEGLGDVPVYERPELSFPEQDLYMDEDYVQPHVDEDSARKFEKVYDRRGKGGAASTDPTQRRGVRRTKNSQSTQAPYVAPPPFKVKKLSLEEKKILEVLTRRPKKDGPLSEDETCIKLKGAKWPLTFDDVHKSFRQRGLVSKLVIHTVRDWLMIKELNERPKEKRHPKRHIFHPDFAINLLKVEAAKFNNSLKDMVDLHKIDYDVMNCDLVVLPVLVGDGEAGHWFCVAISLVDLRTQVLDSLQPSDLTERTANVKTLRNNFFQLLINGQRKLRHTAEKYIIEYPPVPQQDNCHDCGIYVIKFMELWKGRMSSAEMDHETVADVRRRILISLFMDDSNEQRDSVIEAASLRS